MYWVPVLFVSFKVVVFAIGMFFAIKWHYDQEKTVDRSRVLRVVGTVAAVFVPSLLCVLSVTFALAKMLGLDLTMP